MRQRRQLLFLAIGALICVALLLLLLFRGKAKLLPTQTVLSGGRYSYIDPKGDLYYTSGTTFSKKTAAGKFESLTGQYDLPDITDVAWGTDGAAFSATNYNGNKLLFDEYIAKQGGSETANIWWYIPYHNGEILQLVVPANNSPQADEESPPDQVNAVVRDDKQENLLASAANERATYVFDLTSELTFTVATGDCKILQVRLPKVLLGCGGVANNETYILYNTETKKEEKQLKDKSSGRPYIVEGGLVMREYKPPQKVDPNQADSHEHERPAKGNVVLLGTDNSQRILKKSFDGVLYTNLVDNEDYLLFSDGVEQANKPFKLNIMRLKDQKTSGFTFYQQAADNIDDIRLTRISADQKDYSFLLTNRGNTAVYEMTKGNLQPQYSTDKVPNLFANQGAEIKQENYTIVYDPKAKAVTIYYPIPGPNGPIDKQALEYLTKRGVDVSQLAFRVQPDTLRNQ